MKPPKKFKAWAIFSDEGAFIEAHCSFQNAKSNLTLFQRPRVLEIREVLIQPANERKKK